MNEELVKACFAWVRRQYCHGKDCRECLQLEKEARPRRAGLWGGPNPTPQWEFRRGEKTANSSNEQAATASGRWKALEDTLLWYTIVSPVTLEAPVDSKYWTKAKGNGKGLMRSEDGNQNGRLLKTICGLNAKQRALLMNKQGKDNTRKSALNRCNSEKGREEKEHLRKFSHGKSTKIQIYSFNELGERTCLKCDKLFQSYGKQNRICPKCFAYH